MNNFIIALSLTLIAGLSTGIGSAIAFFAKKTDFRFLSLSMGFSAGVMIYVSLVEIMNKAKDALYPIWGEKTGCGAVITAFFMGMAAVALLERVLPEQRGGGEEDGMQPLMRTGAVAAAAIAIHNFPEGLATFISAYRSPAMALPIVAAIALHNIPEGISVSVPIFYATGSRRRAFWWSFLSGLAEPAGALIGFVLLLPFMTDAVFGLLYAFVAGIMVYMSVAELLPSAIEYGGAQRATAGAAVGMFIMAASLWMFI
ncbi:MAG: zinc transporter ZupT [Eubacteriales bacterium]